MNMVSADDGVGQMELIECNGVDDWTLKCPNNCESLDDTFRHFICSADAQRIAVWGNHDTVWTGAGRDGLQLLVNTVRNRFPTSL